MIIKKHYARSPHVHDDNIYILTGHIHLYCVLSRKPYYFLWIKYTYSHDEFNTVAVVLYPIYTRSTYLMFRVDTYSSVYDVNKICVVYLLSRLFIYFFF